MTQTFTQNPDLTVEHATKEDHLPYQGATVPSAHTIQNILNFSKNLEVKHSKLTSPIEIIKS